MIPCASGEGPLGCPIGPGNLWPRFLAEVNRAWGAFQAARMREARRILADSLTVATEDLKVAHQCTLGIASAYRVLGLTHAVDPTATGRAHRRALQVGLRFMHLASNWLTYAFVEHDHDVSYIDGSAWPITLQESAEEHRVVMSLLEADGRAAGHRSRLQVPFDYRHPSLSIAIVSLCAYPEGHPLPRYAPSNHRLYAQKHGYDYFVKMDRVDDGRPHAWGKVKLMLEYVKLRRWDWVMWADCDVYFMNLTVTLDSILFRYGADLNQNFNQGTLGTRELQLDPSFHFLVTEDHAMMNTGIFFVRSSAWSDAMLERIWGPQDSVWIQHPWWEQAAMGWDFWADLPNRFRDADHSLWDAGQDADEMQDIYPSAVIVAPQVEFNSYHPITSRFLADTWAPGKFVLAFNGVTASSSPNVARELYKTYYERFCLLNGVESSCSRVPDTMPWDMS